MSFGIKKKSLILLYQKIGYNKPIITGEMGFTCLC